MAASPAFIGVAFCVPLPLDVATERVEDLVAGILGDDARNERRLNRILQNVGEMFMNYKSNFEFSAGLLCLDTLVVRS